MEIRPIDLHHLGREHVICAWLVGETIVDPGPASCLDTLLEGLGDVEPRALALTHIHLDHAGASGSLVRKWPNLEVHVHERGARHMADPEKLLASATRLYGEDMDRLWGEFLAVPRENLKVLTGGERFGGLEVAYTPGHASHHVSYLAEDGVAFAGDVAGVRVAPSEFVLAPTPPPDIDLELWHRSIDRVRAWRPERLALTHFGAFEDVDGHLSRVAEQLDHWAGVARVREMDDFITQQRAYIVAATGPERAAVFEQAAPPDQGWQGLTRYWSRR